MKEALALALAFAAAILLAAGAVFQWLGHQRCVRRGLSGWTVVRERTWWMGIATSGAGTLCHYAALWMGMVALVLPVSGLHLVFTALAMAKIRRSSLSGLQPWGIAAVAIGVLLCLSGELARSGGPDRFDPRLAEPILLLAAGALLLVVLRGAAERFALGSGLCFGVSAAAWKLMSLPDHPVALAISACVFAASYGVAFLLVQAGFRRGGAASVNATSNGAATATGVVCAHALFGEPMGALAWGGLALVAAGVVLSGREGRPAV